LDNSGFSHWELFRGHDAQPVDRGRVAMDDHSLGETILAMGIRGLQDNPNAKHQDSM